jgi:hypothetical protein
MEVYISKPLKYDIKTIVVIAVVRYPEDADFIEEKLDDQNRTYNNYINDDAENPKMPFIEVLYDAYGNKRFYWQPTIDLENGIIINWPKGVKAHILYKVCDEFECVIYDKNDNEVLYYEGYVPDFMAIEDEGYGDYIDMVVDENGYIKDWWVTPSNIQNLVD